MRKKFIALLGVIVSLAFTFPWAKAFNGDTHRYVTERGLALVSEISEHKNNISSDDKKYFKSKAREAVNQMLGNVIIPVAFVGGTSRIYDKYKETILSFVPQIKYSKDNKILKSLSGRLKPQNISKLETLFVQSEPEKIIHIEDVASQEEIETAMRIRYTEGKHVIPVPSIEVTRSAPQIVYDSMKVFMGKKGHSKRNQTYEKTIVRPEFSRPDKEELSEAVLTQMVRHAIGEYDPVMKVKKVRRSKNQDGSYSVSITLRLPVRHYIGSTISDLQEYVTECIEKYGGIMVKSASIEIEEWG